MLDDLSKAYERVGLRMNMDKTKIMSNAHVVPTPITIRAFTLEVVDDYVYLLGQTIQLGRSISRKRSIVEPDSAGQHSGSYGTSFRQIFCSVSRRESLTSVCFH
jgi:hypothetical protein